jgi:hypothetical protein
VGAAAWVFAQQDEDFKKDYVRANWLQPFASPLDTRSPHQTLAADSIHRRPLGRPPMKLNVVNNVTTNPASGRGFGLNPLDASGGGTAAAGPAGRLALNRCGIAGSPRGDAAPQEGGASERSQPRDPAGSHVPGGGAFQTFVGGEGI